jgi:Mn2+/Fe2+ NRAMP family transporter
MAERFNSPNNQAASVNAQPIDPPRGVLVKGEWSRRLLTFWMILGPGLIVMMADNDAGAVSTYTQAGAQYGTSLLWLLFLLLPVSYFTQEMVVRLGIATGEGHAAMIYKRFGKWWGRFSLADLLLVNFLTLVTEFAAIALAMAQTGVSPYIAVPMAAIGLMVVVSTSSYRRWEGVTIFLCVLDLAWFILAAHTQFTPVALDAKALPNLMHQGITTELIFLVIAIVGTTIAPWQLFFQQSCIADKRLRFADIKWSQLDTFLGSIFTISIAGCMMLVGNAARLHGFSYVDPAQMAVSLGTIYGPAVRTVILMLMCNAAVLGTSAISLASAWAYGEIKGWPHSLQLKVKEAPGFYAVYFIGVSAAAGIVLIPGAPLQLMILSVQVLAGMMLPSAIIFLQLLLNDKELLGEYANRRWNNIINWTVIVLLFVLSLVLAVQVVAPDLIPAI